MATRSFIGMQQCDGTIRAIYCHWNGLPCWNGRTLLESWNDPAAIEHLLALGDLSELGSELGKRHASATHSTQHPTWCLAFGRDYGWPTAEYQDQTYADVAAFLQAAAAADAEYAYLFIDRWYVVAESAAPVPVADLLAAEVVA